MTLATNLLRRGARYYFRSRVPVDLSFAFSCKHIVMALGTSDPGIARERAARVRYNLLQEVRKMQELELGFDEGEGERSADTWIDSDNDEVLILHRSIKRPFRRKRLHWGFTVKLTRDDLDEDMIDGIPAHTVQRFIDAYNGDMESFSVFNLQDRTERHSPQVITRAHGKTVNYALAETVEKLTVNDPYEDLDETARLPWNDENHVQQFKTFKKLNDLQWRDYDYAFRLLAHVVGDKPANAIKRRDIVRYRGLLQSLPSNLTKKARTTDVAKALAWVEACEQRPKPMASATVAKLLGKVRVYLEWMRDNNLCHDNPASDVFQKTPKSEKKHVADYRDAYTIAELRKIFSAPIFTGALGPQRPNQPGTYSFRDHHYFWAPLIALYSGARCHEIGQLEVADIVEYNGRPHFHIYDTGDEEVPEDVNDCSGKNAELPKEQRSNRRLKSIAATRYVPIHQELVKLGFLDYVKRIKRRGYTRLFPEWQAGRRGYYSDTFGRFWTREDGGFLSKIGLKRKGLVFHSFRSNFQQVLDRAKVTEPAQTKMIGHSESSIRERYRNRYLEDFESNMIDNIIYPGLDLSHLYPKR